MTLYPALRLALTAICAGLLAGCAMTPTPQAEELGGVSVPFRFDYGGLVVLDVMVNGEGPFEFFIDTGSTTTALYESLQEELAIAAEPGILRNVYGVAARGQFPLVIIDAFSVAGLPAREVPSVALPDWPESPRPRGIIGLDFLKDHVVVIDPKKGRATLFPTDQTPVNYFNGWDRLPLYPRDTRYASLPVMTMDALADRTAITAVFDTGAVSAFINEAAIARINLRRRRKKIPREQIFEGVNGEFFPASTVQIGRIEIDDILWEDVDMIVHQSPLPELFGDPNLPLMILGVNFFNQGPFAVDVANNALYMKTTNWRQNDPGRRIYLGALTP